MGRQGFANLGTINVAGNESCSDIDIVSSKDALFSRSLMYVKSKTGLLHKKLVSTGNLQPSIATCTLLEGAQSRYFELF